MIFAPLLGFRHVEVTDTRTRIDFAHVCRDLVDQHFPDGKMPDKPFSGKLTFETSPELYSRIALNAARRPEGGDTL